MKITFDQAHDFLRGIHSCIVDQTHLGRLIVGNTPDASGQPFIIIDSPWHGICENVLERSDKPIEVTESGSFLFYTGEKALEFPIEILALVPKRYR